MAWNDTLTKLNYYLADRYPFQEQSVRLVRAAGIPLAFVRFNPACPGYLTHPSDILDFRWKFCQKKPLSIDRTDSD